MRHRSPWNLSTTVSITLALVVGGARAQVLRTVEDELKAGEEAAKQVEEQMGLYKAPATEAYVRAIGERLVSKLGSTPYTFTFQIVDQFEPNAFAVPGGHIYISRGLLMLANSEDEIAGVIGHEIIHVTQRHSARQSRKSILPGVLSVPGAVVGGVVGEDVGALINAPITTIGKVSLAKYSRGQEREADKLGMALAAKAGYEPLALATILVQLESEVEALTGEQRKASFFDSHPTTPKRVKGIEKGAASLAVVPQPAITSGRSDFLGRLDGLHFGDNPAQGLFRGQQFLHPDVNFTITFPDGWQTVNNPTVVGAIAPERNALATLGILGGAIEPSRVGEAFASRLKRRYQVEPTEARPVEVGEWPGYLVTVTEGRGSRAANLHYVWVAMGEWTYQLVAAGPESARSTLRQIGQSLRPLTVEERGSITATRLRIATAEEGETLDALGQRTGNVWSVSFTELVNHMEPGDSIVVGRLIKIARQELH